MTYLSRPRTCGGRTCILVRLVRKAVASAPGPVPFRPSSRWELDVVAFGEGGSRRRRVARKGGVVGAGGWSGVVATSPRENVEERRAFTASGERTLAQAAARVASNASARQCYKRSDRQLHRRPVGTAVRVPDRWCGASDPE